MALLRDLSDKDIDHGYAWVILVASFFAHTVHLGMATLVGVFFDIFRVEFQGSCGAIAFISSLNAATFCMAGPVAGALTNTFGHRPVAMFGGFMGSLGLISSRWATSLWHLYITYGLIGGYGFGIGYIPSVTIVGHYFDKKRMIALGIAVSGCGFGMFIFPPMIRLFVHKYGWRGGMTLTGVVCLSSCISGALMRSPDSKQMEHTTKTEIKDKPDKQSKNNVINISIFRKKDYLVMCANNSLLFFGISIVNVHLAAYSATLGFSKDEAALLFSVVGIANFFGRIFFGLLANTRLCGPMMWYIQGLLCCGITTALTPLAYNYIGLAACAAGFGFSSACYGPLVPQILIDSLGMELLNNAYGYLMIFCALGTLLGAPVAGWLYDRSKYYPASFYLGGIQILISAVIMLYPWYRSRTATHEEIK